MSQLLAKLGLARESYDNPLDEAAEGYIATGEEVETASHAILEATKESAEIDADLATFDNTTEAATDIDDQAELAEIATEQNQYTPTLAMIQKVALKAALAKVSDRRIAADLVDQQLMPAHESYEGPNGGTLATESLKSTASELWASAKKQIKEIMERIVNFIKGIFDTAGKLEKRATKLKEVTKHAKEGKVKPSGAGAIKVGDKLGTDALDGLKVVLHALEQATNESEVASSLASLSPEATEGKIISFTGGTVPSELKSGVPDGAEVTCSAEASGGVVFASVKGKGDGAIRDSFNTIHKTAKKAGPEESDALTTEQCNGALTTVIAIAKACGAAKGVATKFDNFVKQFEKNIDAAAKNEDKEKQQAAKSKFAAGLTFARKVTAFRKDIITHALQAGNAMCNYVEVSCKGAKAEDKKTDDKKDDEKK